MAVSTFIVKSLSHTNNPAMLPQIRAPNLVLRGLGGSYSASLWRNGISLNMVQLVINGEFGGLQALLLVCFSYSY
jgi:hypothetical protein